MRRRGSELVSELVRKVAFGRVFHISWSCSYGFH